MGSLGALGITLKGSCVAHCPAVPLVEVRRSTGGLTSRACTAKELGGTGKGVGLREGCVHAEFSKCRDEGLPLVLGGLMNTQRWPFVQGTQVRRAGIEVSGGSKV